MPGAFALSRQNLPLVGHPRCHAGRRYIRRVTRSVLLSLSLSLSLSLAVGETEKDGAGPNGQTAGMCASSSPPVLPLRASRILPYPLTELTGRKRRYRCATRTARARARNAYCADRRSARTAHILLHMRTSRHAESALRPQYITARDVSCNLRTIMQMRPGARPRTFMRRARKRPVRREEGGEGGKRAFPLRMLPILRKDFFYDYKRECVIFIATFLPAAGYLTSSNRCDASRMLLRIVVGAHAGGIGRKSALFTPTTSKTPTPFGRARNPRRGPRIAG